MVGLRPGLTLGTKDGAFFSPDDLVRLVLTDNDKVCVLVVCGGLREVL